MRVSYLPEPMSNLICANEITNTVINNFLIDTINDDLEPTLKEVKHSVDDVKNVVQKTTNTLKDSLSKVRMVILSSAYGILTGFKDYLSSCKTSEGSYNDNGRSRNRETATGR